MDKVGIAILGLGVVGGGTYKILTGHAEDYKKTHNLDIKVECVLERNQERIKKLGVSAGTVVSNIAEVCSNPEVDIVIETLGGVEPAKSFVLSALKAGKSVVTSNKELYCKYGYELENTAKKNNCGLFYEATCVGGVPVIRAMLDNLQGNNITSLMGIINGTTNYILTKMSACGGSYGEILKEAQALGYAESDPASDVEGFDSAYKLSILSSIAFNTKIPYTEIYREGITEINYTDIKYAEKLGYKVKLLAIGKCGDKGIEVRVHPALIKSDHPLANVNDSFNAVFITGDSVGDVMLYGRGAGALPTGSAIVGDVIYCATHNNFNYSTFENTEKADTATKFIKNFSSAYYIRINATDKAGVLSHVTSVLGKNGISVAQVIQDSVETDGNVTIVLITHETNEKSVNKAIKDINSNDISAKVISILRVA